MRLFYALTLLLLMHSGAEAVSHKKPHVAVLNFRALDVSQSLAEITGNYLEMELLRSNKLVLLEREQVKKSYRLHELNQYSCKDRTCAVFAGRLLETDYVIFGDIEKKGGLTVTAKVVSVSSETTILTCSESFSSMRNARKPIKKIADKIIAAILNTQNPPSTSYKKTPGKKNRIDPAVCIHISPMVFQPMGNLRNLIKTGTGFTCGLMFTHMFPRGTGAAQHITAGFDSGFLYAPGITNKNDSFMMAPFLLSFGYTVKLFEKIYCTPLVSGGISYLVFHHTTGRGFDMEENSNKDSVDGLFRFTALFGRPVAKNLHLQTMLSFWLFTETPLPPYFLTVHVGIQYCFTR